jgi:hypothetical protein
MLGVALGDTCVIVVVAEVVIDRPDVGDTDGLPRLLKLTVALVVRDGDGVGVLEEATLLLTDAESVGEVAVPETLAMSDGLTPAVELGDVAMVSFLSTGGLVQPSPGW